MTAPHQSLLGSGAVAETEETDPNFNQTVLLLDGDGTNGGQNNSFVDSSGNDHTIARNGTPTQGTFNPYLGEGQYSTSFAASGDRLSMSASSDFQFGTGDFTVELFVYFTNPANDKSMIDFRPSNGTYTDAFGFTIAGTALKIFDNADKGLGGTLSANTWHHVVLQRISGGLHAHVDGTATGTTVSYSVDLNASGTQCTIGSVTGASTAQFNGFISSVRITKGTALYGTGNFTSPSSFLTTTSQGATASEVKLLTCQSNRYIDNSNSGRSIAINGTPKVIPFVPFAPTASYNSSVHGGSGYFDGNGDYLRFTDNLGTDLAIGTSDFEFSAWLYLTTSSGTRMIYDGRPAVNGFYPILTVTSSNEVNIAYNLGGTVTEAKTSVLKSHQWLYISWSRVGSTTKIFVNGTEDGSTSDSANLLGPGTGDDPFIGSGYAAGDYFQGFICDFKFRIGVGITSQTVPTAPATSDSYTKILLNFTNASIIDHSMKHNFITIGNAQISTSTKKFGTGSISFDGTNSQLITGTPVAAGVPDAQGVSIPGNYLVAFGTADFTVECFVNHTGTANNEHLVGNRESGSVGTEKQWSLHYFTTDNEPRWHTSGSELLDSNDTTTPGTFHHLAVTRESGTHRIFIDGVQKNTTTSAKDYTDILCISLGKDDHAGFFNGFLDSVRVTYGVARYSSSGFTPPTKAFPKR